MAKVTADRLAYILDEKGLDKLIEYKLSDLEEALRDNETTAQMKHHIKAMMKTLEASKRFSHHAHELLELVEME